LIKAPREALEFLARGRLARCFGDQIDGHREVGGKDGAGVAEVVD